MFLRSEILNETLNKVQKWLGIATACRGREEGRCAAPIWKEVGLVEEISRKLGITCDETGIADMGTILIGAEIEWTA